MRLVNIILLCVSFILLSCATKNLPTPKDVKVKQHVLNLKWTNKNLSHIIQGSFLPIIDKDNTIYAADVKGGIVKLDSTDGTVIDKFNIDDDLISGMALSSDMLYVTTKKAKLLAISKFKHQIEWSVQLSTLAIEPPQYAQNKVIVKTNDAIVSCYDAQTGSLMWVFQRQSPILTIRTNNTMELNTGGDVMLLGENSGKVAIINLNNGLPLFEVQISIPNGATDIDKINDVTSRPILIDKIMCAATYNGKLSCIDAVTSNLLWSEPFNSYIQIISDKENLYAVNNEGVIFAFDLNTGIKRWSSDDLKYRKLFSPSIIGDFFIVGDVDGNIYAINKFTGNVIDVIDTSLIGGLSYPINNNYRTIYQATNGIIAGIYIK
jgi:outer membrane protein assembly factor BamB